MSSTTNDRMTHDMVMVLLRGVLDELEAGRLGALMDLGLDVETMIAFRDVTMKELKYIATRNSNWAEVKINATKLKANLARARESCEEERLAEQMLLQGASAPMMQALWGWSPGETSARKRALGIAVSLGRTPLPSDDARDDVLVHWRQLCRDVANERHRYLMLTERTGYRLDTLWQLTQPAEHAVA